MARQNFEMFKPRWREHVSCLICGLLYKFLAHVTGESLPRLLQLRTCGCMYMFLWCGEGWKGCRGVRLGGHRAHRAQAYTYILSRHVYVAMGPKNLNRVWGYTLNPKAEGSHRQTCCKHSGLYIMHEPNNLKRNLVPNCQPSSMKFFRCSQYFKAHF